MRPKQLRLGDHEAVLVQVALEDLVRVLDPDDIEAFLAACRKLERLGVNVAWARELVAGRQAGPADAGTDDPQKATAITVQVCRAHGIPEPQVVIPWCRRIEHRMCMTMVTAVATGIWRATPPGEGWNVIVPYSGEQTRDGTRAVLRVELASGSEVECERAVRVLEEVVRRRGR